jgi:hypothetical protein
LTKVVEVEMDSVEISTKAIECLIKEEPPILANAIFDRRLTGLAKNYEVMVLTLVEDDLYLIAVEPTDQA